MWFYNDQEVKTLEDLERESGYELPFGFVYVILYTDGTYYIGKKQVWTYKESPALKFDKIRKGHAGFVNRRKKKSIVKMERHIVEHKWQEYEGSHTQDRADIHTKRILEIAKTKRHLTYLEAKYQFLYNVLEDPYSLNNNILGSFFKGNLET